MKNIKHYYAVLRNWIWLLMGLLRIPIYRVIFGENYYQRTHKENLQIGILSSFTSQICNTSHFDMPFFGYWIKKLKGTVMYHRKQWEYVYICQTLHELGLLKEGKKGLVFGCGKEPLVALFASLGCKITATDLDPENKISKSWIDSNQHIKTSYLELNSLNICDKELFMKNVSYRNVDMNDIPADLEGYDFCWSASSLEHLGSINNGLEFIKNSLNVLKDGGYAIHITEYNLSSNKGTIESAEISVFRECDIKKIINELEEQGHEVFPLLLEASDSKVNNYVDYFPYEKQSVHLKLKIGKYSVTSLGLIIKKSNK